MCFCYVYSHYFTGICFNNKDVGHVSEIKVGICYLCVLIQGKGKVLIILPWIAASRFSCGSSFYLSQLMPALPITAG